MNKEDRKLAGYIVYEIYTYRVSEDRGVTWKTRVPTPEVHWKKKIYTTITDAKNAVKDIHERTNEVNRAVIVPIYTDRTDLNLVQDAWKELKDEVETLNQNKDESLQN
jgi:TPP-dependent indolepyruvate ferredoxin oxidoreductase alpha subunit